jgi:hypothetical protein
MDVFSFMFKNAVGRIPLTGRLLGQKKRTTSRNWFLERVGELHLI